MDAQDLKVAIVGSGNIGSVVARLAASAGMEVFLSNSRGPETLADLAAELGDRVHASTVREAVAASDVVVVSIPLGRYRDLPADAFEGRLVLDATNFIPFRDADVADLAAAAPSPSHLLQDFLPGADVVKAFSNIYSGHLLALARPAGSKDRSALPVAGDISAAKVRATELLNLLGWDAVDAGPLVGCSRFEVGRPVFVKAYMADPSGSGEDWGARMTTDPGKPLPAHRVRELLSAEA
ncbi:NADP oxidoreductase [Serinibacter arcticus]|uniref:NADP oxidoreductase n=1 Tax=Serinibacter arcticus TaxID=1655435 RepID=A0A2U1ZSF1_9MICO|nr:NAD(P)-binding domain-containing protein [Serinibacter arcticus]PWD49880.1 NADP oxidoreductase [Serinibacter arcticus]